MTYEEHKNIKRVNIREFNRNMHSHLSVLPIIITKRGVDLFMVNHAYLDEPESINNLEDLEKRISKIEKFIERARYNG